MPRTEIKTLVLPPLADIPRASLVTGILLGLLATLLQTGCARQSTVHAESREIPLTSGEGFNQRPCFSADGKYITYTQNGEGIQIVPAQGGEPRKISTDVTSEVVGAWTGEDELLVWSYGILELRWMDLEGKVLKSQKTPGEAVYFRDLSPDQKQILWCDYSDHNAELGISPTGTTDIEFLAQTPERESRGSFGPDPGEVTVVRQASATTFGGDILIWSAKDRLMTPIPVPKGINNYPAWSPDRRYMAYTSDNSGNMELWVYDRESDKAVQLTASPGYEEFPKWSPDGEWITFARVSRWSEIFVHNLDNEKTRPLTTGNGTDRSPVLSEDGEWVVYYREIPVAETGQSSYAVCVASISDGTSRVLDTGGLKIHVEPYGPWGLCWSPDGKQIGFTADDGTGNLDIYRISRTSGAPQRVTLSPGNDTSPSWSPDGSTIAYRREADGKNQIWAIPATGGIPKQLTASQGVPLSYVWGADSDQLAYAAAASYESSELWVTSYRAPERSRRLLGGDHGYYPVAWSADNKEILVVEWGKDSLPMFAVSAGTSDIESVGKMYMTEKGYVPQLSENGTRFKDRLCPTGIFVAEKGRERSHIYSLHVPALIQAKLTASGEWN